MTNQEEMASLRQQYGPIMSINDIRLQQAIHESFHPANVLSVQHSHQMQEMEFMHNQTIADLQQQIARCNGSFGTFGIHERDSSKY